MAVPTMNNTAILRLLIRLMIQVRPDFKFSSARLNNNYSAPMHTDSNNRGPSVLLALGDFRMGRLWVQEALGPPPVQYAAGPDG